MASRRLATGVSDAHRFASGTNRRGHPIDLRIPGLGAPVRRRQRISRVVCRRGDRATSSGERARGAGVVDNRSLGAPARGGALPANYRAPLYHYPSFLVTLAELALTADDY